jgi:D-mannonate dehydratase
VVDHGRFSSDEKIRLGLPGRDEEIEHFKVFFRNMGRPGIPAYIQ